MSLTIHSERLTGVRNIVRFNFPFYLGSCAGLAAVTALLASRLLPRRLRFAVWCGASLLLFWTFSSLLVSWYVYDYAGVTNWEWLRKYIPIDPSRWANIHAGLDESTPTLRRFFPASESSVIDIYDPVEMTEPSIARARKIYPAAEPFLLGRSTSLPLANEEQDAIFLLFAAHEVRNPARRTQLLRETARALKAGGQVVLVEHLRDWKNLLAFGPGFLHFHSLGTWRQNIKDAELWIEQEMNVTPFVRCFVLRKVAA